MTPATLDVYQQRIVGWRHGAALVLATAGSGKTHCLVERTIALVNEGVALNRILLLTYNRDAADLLRRRLTMRLGPRASALNVSTFHAFAWGLLRTWLGGEPAFSRAQLASDESAHARREIRRIAENAARAAGLNHDTKDLLKIADYVREHAVPIQRAPSTEATSVQRVAALPFCKGDTYTAGRLLMFMRGFQEGKFHAGWLDYGDMLYIATNLIRARDPRVAYLHGFFAHVMVDEAQDCSAARWTVVEAAATGAQSLLAVADSRQAINAYSGADVEIILNFAERATTLELPTNRRSTEAIVNATNAITRGRRWNLGGDAAASLDGGVTPVLWRTQDAHHEAESIAEHIRDRVLERPGWEGVSPGTTRFAIVVRTNAQAVDIEHALLVREFPVRLRGHSGGVWTSTPGKAFLTYLRTLEGRPTDEIANISNKPLRYIKRVAIEQVVEEAGTRNANVIDALCASPQKRISAFGEELKLLAAKPWEARCAAVAKLLTRDVTERKAEANKTGSLDLGMLAPDEDDVAVFAALAATAAQRGSVAAIEAEIAKMTKGSKGPAIEISTIHRLKGGEADVVFVAGANAQKMPHTLSDDIDEERRLFYVACTRARFELVVSVGGKTPTPFLTEMLQEGLILDPDRPARTKGVDSSPESAEGASSPAGVKRRRKKG